MERVLLVNPKSPGSRYSKFIERRFLKLKSVMTPLPIATIAALTPDDMEADLWDENVHGPIDETTEFGKDYDLVGLTGYPSHFRRVRRIVEVFRQRGIPIAIGGVGVSATPGKYRDLADILFIGEAELTWPQFIEDWRTGNYREEYRQVTKPDLTLSPPPRWDSLADRMDSYLIGAVQTTRGCPFDCEFCSVVHLFGRQIRQKPVDRVLEEVATLERLGIQRIFFSDDNFIGNPRYTKELLRKLIPVNNSFRRQVEFSTQLSINVARDEEILELLADANFSMLVIGIETPNKESLRETHKYQNVRSDLMEDCKKIQSYGLLIRAAMIVGFDNDTSEIFDQQFEFTQRANIPLVTTSTLTAFAGTKLWHRLKKEGRILKPDDKFRYPLFRLTNIIPKRMSRVELLSGYSSLLERNFDWRHFVARVKRMLLCVKRKPNLPQKKKKRQWKNAFQLLQFLLFVDKDVRHAILSIVWYTRRHAPFMMEKVFLIVVHQCAWAVTLGAFREKYYKWLELEKSVNLEQFIDRSAVKLEDDS